MKTQTSTRDNQEQTKWARIKNLIPKVTEEAGAWLFLGILIYSIVLFVSVIS